MQLAGGIIGAAIGSMFGATALGWSLGSSLGGMLAKPERQVQSSPKVDLRIPGTQDGRVIPWLIGRMRMAPDWIWNTDRRPHTTTTTSGGKGGEPEVVSENTTYDMDCLLLLNIEFAAGMIEVYIAGELVYRVDASADSSTIAASVASERWGSLTVYTGGPSQLPHPTYEAAVGVGHAPAYRGRLTIAIDQLQLGPSGQIPQIEFVAVSDGESASETNYYGDMLSVSGSDDDSHCQYDPALNEIWMTDRAFAAGYASPDRLAIYNFGTATTEYVSIPESTSHPGEYWAISVDDTAELAMYPELDICLVGVRRPDDNFDTLSFRISTREFLGSFADALSDNIAEHFVVDVVNERVLVDTFIGEMNICTMSDGLPTGIFATVTGVGGVYGKGICTNDGDFWLNRGTSSGWSRISSTGVHTIFTVDAGEVMTDKYTYCYDTVRDCIYYWSRIAESGNLYIKKIDCQTGAVTNIRAFDEDLVPRGPLYYAADMDRIISVRQPTGIAEPGSVYIVDPDTGDLENEVEIEGRNSNPFLGGGAYYSRTVYGPALDGFGEVIFDLFTPSCLSVQAAQERLCARAGYAASEINAAPLAAITREVCCLPWSDISPARQPSETMMGAYFYEAVCSGGKIKFVPRGEAVLGTVPYTDLGARLVSGASAANDENPFPLRIVNDLETPAFSHVNYINLAANFADGSEPTDRLTSTSSVTRQPLELNLGLFPAEAKGVIDSVHRDRASAVARARISLLRSEWPTVEPTDCLSITGPDGSEYRMRIVQTIDRFPVVACDVVIDEPSVLQGQGITTTDYESQTTVSLPPDTDMLLADLPLLRTEDDFLGPIVAVKPDGDGWHGARVFVSPDDLTFVSAATINEEAIFGVTTTALPDYTGPRHIDFCGRVRVNVGEATLTSSTRALVRASQAINAFAIGDDATGYEVGQYIDAELISADPNIYELSNIIRGSRGTNWRMTGHAAGENFILLRGEGMRKLTIESAQLGATRYYKPVTLGRPETTGVSEDFVCNGVSAIPFSPSKVRVTRDEDGNVHIVVTRRTRKATRYTGALGVSVPLGEDTEAYTIRIYADGTYTTIVDSLSMIGTNEVDYTAAAQILAGLTPGDPLFMDIHQLSAEVGMGYALRRAA